jgi:hypothetical protein
MWIPWIIHEEEERGQGGFQQDFGAINLDKEDNDHFQEANLHFFKCWRPCRLCSSKCRDHRQAKKVGKVRQVGMQQRGEGLGQDLEEEEEEEEEGGVGISFSCKARCRTFLGAEAMLRYFSIMGQESRDGCQETLETIS